MMYTLADSRNILTFWSMASFGFVRSGLNDLMTSTTLIGIYFMKNFRPSGLSSIVFSAVGEIQVMHYVLVLHSRRLSWRRSAM